MTFHEFREIRLPKMEEYLQKLTEDGVWVEQNISPAEYLQIGLLMKIYEGIHNIENSTRGTR